MNAISQMILRHLGCAVLMMSLLGAGPANNGGTQPQITGTGGPKTLPATTGWRKTGQITKVPTTTTAAPKPFPEFSAVEQHVRSMLLKIPGYQKGDLLAQGDVFPLFAQLEQVGWKVADQAQIVKQILPDSDFVVVQLRTPRGQAFMRQVSRAPETYDRIDRFRRIPRGEKIIRQMIHDPGGYTLFQYMATTPGGINMGRQLSRTPNGVGFNEPTGRIYTGDQLIDRLKESYALELKRRKAAPKLPPTRKAEPKAVPQSTQPMPAPTPPTFIEPTR